MVREGCHQPGHRTLKLTVSQDWIDEMNWFFACWCKFIKVKNNFNDLWMDAVKNGRDHLVHETLKSAECVYELSWFLQADCDVIIFDKNNIVLYIFDF